MQAHLAVGALRLDVMSELATSRARRAEIWTFWLGVASLTCLGPLTGIVAVGLGASVLAKKGQSPLALAGVLSGAFGTAAGIVVLTLAASFWPPRHPVVLPARACPPGELAEQPAPHPTGPVLPPGHPRIGPVPHEDEAAVRTATKPIGTLTWVEVGSHEPHSLAELMAAHRREGAPLLVYVRAPQCAPCTRFEVALPSAAMQRALGGSVLLAVDAGIFEDDLAALHIDARDVPTFVKVALGSEGPAAVDAMTGAEWDDDTPANMAPVFSRFLSGTLQTRRQAPPFVGTAL